MNDPLIVSLFPGLESINTKKNTNKNNTNFTKDLFTKKLGHKVNFELNKITKRLNPNSRLPNFFKNISTFPKNNSNPNLYSSFRKKNYIDKFNKIVNTRNKPTFSNSPRKGFENKKQTGETLLFESFFKNFHSKNKKDIKRFLENNMSNNKSINNDNKISNNISNFSKSNKIENYSNIQPNRKILDSIVTFKHNYSYNYLKYNSNTESNNKSNKSKNNIKNSNFNNNIIKKKKNKIFNNALKEENKKEINNYYYKKDKNELIKDENNSKIFIKSFFEDFINISNIYESFLEYKNSINNFNETYFYLFKINSFPTNIKMKMNIKFLEIYKYTGILVICLIFLSRDENLYNENINKMKELLLHFIYISIISIDYKMLESSQINFFVDTNKEIDENQNETLLDKLNEIINIIFLEKKNEYKKIRKCLKQLSNNIDSLNSKQIFYLLNKTILFCHNYQYLEKDKEEKSKEDPNKNQEIIKSESTIKTEIINTNSDNKDNNEENNNETKLPFINKKMTKKFCLVLNLNETIIHNMNLPYGDYFFVRPGFFDLIKKIKNNYEIIILTEKEEKYVDDIIKKLNYDNSIDYILYKNKLKYEEGQLIQKLELIGRNLNKIIYVDNSEISAKYCKKNLYKISSWYNNIFDNELFILKEKLNNIANSNSFNEDITKAINNS